MDVYAWDDVSLQIQQFWLLSSLACGACRTTHLFAQACSQTWVLKNKGGEKLPNWHWYQVCVRCSWKHGCNTNSTLLLHSGSFYRASSHHGHTKNSELTVLFACCACLLSFPLFPIFVFNGPEQPAEKHGKIVHGTPHWLARDTQEMLDCFEIPWIEVGQSQHHLHASCLICSAGRQRGRGRTSLDVERGADRCHLDRWLWCLCIWCGECAPSVSVWLI